MKYQEHEMRAYFGEFYDEYADKAREMLEEHDWDVIEHYMDDDLREELHRELAPCSNERFLLAYMMRHTEKFGEDYAIG